MEKEEYSLMYNVEEKHWWFRGMRKITSNLIRNYTPGKNLKILDAGCGTGMNMKFLQNYGEVYGIDFSDEALKFCKLRQLKNIKKANVCNIPFEDNSFDLVTSFDVIYHLGVEDDVLALKEFYRVLNKGGTLIFRVPAGKSFISEHDKKVHTRERYDKKDVKERLSKTNFKILRITYSNFFLLPIILFTRHFSKERKDMDVPSKLVNSILVKTLYLEAFLLKFFNLPAGTSLFCVCTKN